MKKTPIYDWHVNHGNVVDFAGWALPVRITNINEEHMAVRENAGIFDTSHMGRFMITGKDARQFLDTIVARNIQNLSPGKAGYTFVLNERGGFHDDVIVASRSENEFFFVCNASNRDKILNWLMEVRDFAKTVNPNYDVNIEDFTEVSAMIAVQGPKAKDVLHRVLEEVPMRWRYIETKVKDLGFHVIVTGTGYTGENGAEITLRSSPEKIMEEAVKLWEFILEKGKDLGVMACGLGARDTLRMEAGLCLYGNDIDEDITANQAGLNFFPFSDLKKPFFFGKRALESDEPKYIRVGFLLEEKGVPRHEYKIFVNDKEVGWVSSGTVSPLLGKGMGIAYVEKEYSTEGQEILIQVRNKKLKAKIHKFPLYDKTKYGYSREA